MDAKPKHIVWMRDIGMDDVAQVGGKNASLGELIRTIVPQGVRVPEGFCVTADAYYYFLARTGLKGYIAKTLDGLDTKNLMDLSKRGKKVRDAIRRTPLPQDLETKIIRAYEQMEKQYGENTDVAVRSSATAEDLPGASFAGEHETYLGIRGAGDVVQAVVWAMASLFTDRAISYRADKGFAHTKVELSVGVQKIVRSDTGASGVMFTVDTESGFKDIVLINATWGLGELIVQGHVTPDEYLVMKSSIGKVKSPIIEKKMGVKNKKMQYALHKKGIIRTKTVKTANKERGSFVLNEEEIAELARWGAIIEKHYSERAKTWTPIAKDPA
ncbi:phosphoenolpyruvate synthase, partial [Candidatus Kaiserbacteria bacterium]|nr:phosphoenolpyruvate synthase [Candidatus Kaiserbacteria bacterium]